MLNRLPRFSVLPVLSLDGIIHCNIIEGSFCTGTFYQFIKGLLQSMQPFPGPNSVIVMDNFRIHKHPEIQRLIQRWYVPLTRSMLKFTNFFPSGMRCVFLPPYSPDMNPIELTFSFMKYNLRCNGQYACMMMSDMEDVDIHRVILEALLMSTPQHAFGWYKHCGYV